LRGSEVNYYFIGAISRKQGWTRQEAVGTIYARKLKRYRQLPSENVLWGGKTPSVFAALTL